MKALGDWLNELKDWDMPVLRRTIVELGSLAGKAQQVAPSQIAAVVLHDPLMTLKVLRLVNGMPRSRLSHEIATVETAVIMLGVGPFFNRHADLKVIEENIPSVEGALPGLMRTLSRAHHAAWQARDWAILQADMKSEELYIAALLYDLGEIMLWAYAPDHAMQILKQSRRKKISFNEAGKEVLGFELRELQFALAEAWNLPEMMRAAMRNEAAPGHRMQGVALAAELARRAETGWHDAFQLASYEVIADMLRFSLNDIVPIVHHNAVAAARHWQWYGVPPAATWLPMLPGEWPEESEVPEVPEVPENGSLAEENVTVADKISMMRDPDILRQVIDGISLHLDGSLNLHDLIAMALRGMHEGIGLDRVVFALMSADREVMKIKYMIGDEAGSPLRQFQIDMTALPAHLFSRLMDKMQGVWLRESNRNVLEPMIPFGIKQSIGHGDFFAMSIFLHGKPVGMFYADQGHDGGELDEHAYLEFKQLCLLTAKGLAHLAKK